MNVRNMFSIYLIEKIVQSLNGKGSSPSTGISGARTSKVMDEIVEEYYKERRKGIRVQRCKVHH